MLKMKNVFYFTMALGLLMLNTLAFANAEPPQLFLFLGKEPVKNYQADLANAFVSGAQIIYSWRQLETQPGVYDFSAIENDLACLNRLHKKLFIQLQDRSFDAAIVPVPDYIREEPAYHGGVAEQYDLPGEGQALRAGWVARVWDAAVRQRFQLLMQTLAAQFDGRIAGINLPETAADVDLNNPPADFTPNAYFQGELENVRALREAFHHSIVIQYVNFFPGEWGNDHHYLSTLFAYAAQHHIGLGGPDVVPYKTGPMLNSYPFFHRFKNRLITGMAIQEPDYTYTNPNTGRPYSFDELYFFARDYLGASILFWNVQEPFFSNALTPKLDGHHFAATSHHDFFAPFAQGK